MKKLPVDRINQLEALQVDEQCKDVLVNKLTDAFQFYDQKKVSRFQPEIQLVVNFLYYKFTVSKNINLPGNQLQNLRYQDLQSLKQGKKGLSQKRIILFFLIQVLGKYIIQKIKNKFLYSNYQQEINQCEDDNDLRRLERLNKFKNIFETVEKIYNLFSTVNYLDFLLTGRYRKLSERILGIRLMYIKQNVSRTLDFELLNRTIIWNLLSDFVIFLLPFAKDIALSKTFQNMFFVTSFLGSLNASSNFNSEENKCGICDDKNICMPRKIKCGHKFCYYCIQNYIENQPGEEKLYKCPRCDEKFVIIQELNE